MYIIAKISSIEERAKYERTLAQSHMIRIKMHVLNLDMEELYDMSDQLLDGQITVSATADISTKTVTATILDPGTTLSGLGIDTGSPVDGILYADKMVRIYYGVYVPDLLDADKWVDIPVFTGPISKFDREGAVVSLEATGKETLAGPVWLPYTIPKGTLQVDAIKQILQKAGENFFGTFPVSTATLGTALVGVSANAAPPKDGTQLDPATVMWSQAEDIAQRMDPAHMLFYDGMGYASLRRLPSTAADTVFSFRSGNVVKDSLGNGGGGGVILDEPQITYDPSLLFNVVRVEGKPPSSGAAPVGVADANVLFPTHPLSPNNLGRHITVNGSPVLVPRYLPDSQQSDSYTTKAACDTAALNSLKSRLDESIELNFNSLVIPHLEANDWCSINTNRINTSFRLRNFTIPLNTSGMMTVGYTSNQIINVVAIRNKRQIS